MIPVLPPAYVETIESTSSVGGESYLNELLHQAKLQPKANALDVRYSWEAPTFEEGFSVNDREKVSILVNFTAALLKDSVQLEPEFTKPIDEQFWTLL